MRRTKHQKKAVSQSSEELQSLLFKKPNSQKTNVMDYLYEFDMSLNEDAKKIDFQKKFYGSIKEYPHSFEFGFLHMAAVTGHKLDILLDQKIDVNSSFSRTKDGKLEKGPTPLILAAAKGRADCVKTLIEHQADVNFQSQHTVCEVIGASSVPVAQLIISSKNYSALDLAAMNGHLGCVQLLVQGGADLKNSSALYFAWENKHESCASYLIEQMTRQGFTPPEKPGAMCLVM